jgi:hypothetical protein
VYIYIYKSSTQQISIQLTTTFVSIQFINYCGVYATNKTGSRSDDWIYYQAVTHSLINYTYTMVIQLYLSFTPVKVRRCTRTRILFFHTSRFPATDVDAPL